MSHAIHTASLALFIASLSIAACTKVTAVICQAVLADIGIKKSRTGRFNVQWIMVTLSFIAGPYLIKFFGKHGYAIIYQIVMVGYLLIFLLIVWVFTETLPQKSDKSARAGNIITKMISLFKNRKLNKILLIWLMFQLGWLLFFQYSGEFLFQYRHLPNNSINMLFAHMSIGILVFQIIFVQPLTSRITPRKILPWSVLLIAVSLIAMGMIPVNIW
ncbi:MAG: MFS transporter, partial [Pseudomonadota bacterium]